MNIENVKTQIDENLKKYLNGEHNVLRGDMALVRKYKNGREMSDVFYGEITSQPIHSGYNMRRRKIEKEISPEEIRKDNKTDLTKNEHSKGTGGQLAYVRLMIKDRDKIKGLSCEAVAIMTHMCFAGIQWNTGKLIQERCRKPHTANTIADIIKKSVRTTKKALKELSDRNIIKYDKKQKLYFMSSDIARKGAVIEDENKI
jgi:hypothetical protein